SEPASNRAARRATGGGTVTDRLLSAGRSLALSPPRAAHAEPAAHRRRRTRPGLLAAAGGLHHPCLAGYRCPGGYRRGANHLFEPVARYPPVSLAAAGPEPLQQLKPRVPDLRPELPLRHR